MINYFAYGSNMDFDRIKNRDSSAKIIGSAILEGFELVFNKVASKNPKISYANVYENEASVTEGILYELDSLIHLDKYEGHPNDYIRKEMEVKCGEKKILAWVYIANEDKVKNDTLPEREYLNHLLSGKEFLSDSYFQKLKQYKTID
jgi:gamma-glutamylcyclotransferase (GGCT)/AIG2-like uncharacterized protein YtfP